MTYELEVMTDAHGIAIIGAPTEVEAFLSSHDLPSRDLELHRLGTAFGSGGAAAGVAAEVAANFGRWVQLTEKSAKAFKTGDLMKGSENGVGRAIIMKNGKTNHILEIVKTPGSSLTNPALLSGAAGLMTQLAMQQTMDQLINYLESIDKKVEAVLRAQKDSVVSAMIGVGLVIDEAMTIRQQVGRVSEVTWSKVQATAQTIASTQAYALRQLDALAEAMERENDVDALAKLAKAASAQVEEWLAVLAKCFQLQDALAVLEIDRVLDTSPEELDRHRLALHTSRQNRTDLIGQSTSQLMQRMNTAASRASGNAQVLLNPRSSRTVVVSHNHVADSVQQLRERLAIDESAELLEARRWTEAAGQMKTAVAAKGAEGVDTARRVGSDGVVRARAAGGKLRGRAADLRARRKPRDSDAPE